jgi:hypothetical protein
VLSGNYLTQYLSDDESQSPLQHLVLANLTIKEVNSVESSSDEPPKYVFEITPSDDASRGFIRTQDTLILAADTPDDRREWTHAIKRVLFRESGGAIFGQHLEETLKYEQQRDATRRVPEIVEMCVEHLRKNGLDSDGLFRLPGRNVVMRQIREAFDAGGMRPSLDDVDVHSVASLLKAFLRELPQPIIPVEHYERVMNIITRERPINADNAVIALSKEISCLPTANYDLLYYLCQFLHEVSCHSDVNRMTASNLATVFSPCFILPEVNDPALLAGTSANRTTAVLDMISKFNCIFMNDPETESNTKRTSVDDSDDTDNSQTSTVDNAAVNVMQADAICNKEMYLDDKKSVEAAAAATINGAQSSQQQSVEAAVLTDARSSQQQQMSKCMNSYCLSATTQVGAEVLSKVELLQQQLENERNLVSQLRQDLAIERSRAAKQIEQLAEKLNNERAATTNAVARVMELQTELEKYSMKFGPLG